MTKRMIDAENIDSVDTSNFDIIAVYGSSFGSPQGPARVTPAAYVRSIRKPFWMIYFPGCNVASALTEAESYGARGVIMDLESQFELDVWSRAACQSAGDYWRSHNMPCVIYCHQRNVLSLATHYDGQWWPGMQNTTPLGPHDAVQFGYPGPYDESITADWWATPPQEDDTMLIVNAGGAGIWLLSGSMYVHIDDPTTLQSLQATGLKEWTVDAAQHALLLAAATAIAVSGTVPVSGSIKLGA